MRKRIIHRCRIWSFVWLFIGLVLTLTQASAGEFNPVLSIGDAAPKWKELPATDGKTYAFDSFKESEVLVVVFTCNSCPYSVDYEDRIIELTKHYSNQDKEQSDEKKTDAKNAKEKKPTNLAVVAINVNLVKEDLLPAMKERAKKREFNFSYLFDETQQTAKDFGATFTPEFFVLNRDRKVVYMGALDDNTDAKKVSRHHVREAIEATLAGTKIEVAETVAIGCAVRYKRTRRKRKNKPTTGKPTAN